MPVTATIRSSIEAAETDTLGLDLASVQPILHRLVGDKELGGSSPGPVTEVWSRKANLAAGVATLDLTALPGKEGTTLNLTGLKVQAIIIRNPAVTSLRVKTGAATGYNIFGLTTSDVQIPAGGSVVYEGSEGTPDVAAGAKNIDLSGTGTAEYQIIILAG